MIQVHTSNDYPDKVYFYNQDHQQAVSGAWSISMKEAEVLRDELNRVLIRRFILDSSFWRRVLYGLVKF